jgi:hypothetical protein
LRLSCSLSELRSAEPGSLVRAEMRTTACLLDADPPLLQKGRWTTMGIRSDGVRPLRPTRLLRHHGSKRGSVLVSLGAADQCRVAPSDEEESRLDRPGRGRTGQPVRLWIQPRDSDRLWEMWSALISEGPEPLTEPPFWDKSQAFGVHPYRRICESRTYSQGRGHARLQSRRARLSRPGAFLVVLRQASTHGGRPREDR